MCFHYVLRFLLVTIEVCPCLSYSIVSANASTSSLCGFLKWGRLKKFLHRSTSFKLQISFMANLPKESTFQKFDR